MKRFLLVLLSVSLALTAFSQAFKRDLSFKLTEVRSSDDLEIEKYSYNDDMLLEAVYLRTVDGEQLIDSLTYDMAHNIVKVDFYQFLDQIWKYVSYIDYTYDENGNRLTRTNYNSFGTGTFTLGGVYHYYYNTDNRQTHWEMYFGGTDLWQLGLLTYNTDGQLILEVGQDKFNSGVMEDSWKIDYQYNSDGTLSNSKQSFKEGSSWTVSGTEMFHYDANKNCIKWEHKSGSTVTDRKDYEYDLEYTADQLLLPIHPEFQTKDLVEMNHKATVYHWHAMNDIGNLVYVCDFNYLYDSLTYTGNTRNAYDVADLRLYPNPTSEELTIAAINAVISELSVVDHAGKLVMRASHLNKKETKLDVTSLKSGVYFIKLATSKGVVVEKLVVQ